MNEFLTIAKIEPTTKFEYDSNPNNTPFINSDNSYNQNTTNDISNENNFDSDFVC